MKDERYCTDAIDDEIDNKLMDTTRFGVDRSFQTTCVATVDAENTLWLVEGWVPIGEVTLLVGSPATGKGQILCAMAARMTQGNDHLSWPGKSTLGWCKVLFLSPEDDLKRVLRPRLEAAGAKIEHIFYFDSIKQNNSKRAFSFANDEDISSLIAFAERVKDIVLIIIDPASQVVDGDFGNNSKVQCAFNKLNFLARRLNCAIIVVAHDCKTAKGKRPLSRVAGSIAVTTVPRFVMLVAKILGGHSDGGGTHVLARAKTSQDSPGGGYEFRFEEVEVSGKDRPIKAPRVVFGKYHPESIEEILEWAENGKADNKIRALDAAINFLKNTLQDGPLPYPEIKKLAEAAGISKATLNRAKLPLSISAKKQEGAGQFSPFVWSLPNEPGKP